MPLWDRVCVGMDVQLQGPADHFFRLDNIRYNDYIHLYESRG